MIAKAETLRLLNRQLTAIKDLQDLDAESGQFIAWRTLTNAVLSRVFGATSLEQQGFDTIGFICPYGYEGRDPSTDVVAFQKGLAKAEAKLRAFITQTELFQHDSHPITDNESTVEILRRIARRFDQVARQLCQRRAGRPVMQITDEYDMQDLLHALLRLYFDDIRCEDCTPSYAGGSSRVDFLIKSEGIIIETKKTRKGLDAKEVGDQLIIDKDRYRQRQDFRGLFCFVYDPDRLIQNAVGVERDLTSHDGQFWIETLTGSDKTGRHGVCALAV